MLTGNPTPWEALRERKTELDAVATATGDPAPPTRQHGPKGPRAKGLRSPPLRALDEPASGDLGGVPARRPQEAGRRPAPGTRILEAAGMAWPASPCAAPTGWALRPYRRVSPGLTMRAAMLKVQIRDRTGRVPVRLQSYTRRKLRQVGRHLDLLSMAEVEFTEESKRSQEPIHVIDLTVRGMAADLEVLRARESGRELLPVIDLALDKLDREVARLKEKVRPYP